MLALLRAAGLEAALRSMHERLPSKIHAGPPCALEQSVDLCCAVLTQLSVAMDDSRSFVEMLSAEIPPLDAGQEDAIYELQLTLPAAMVAWAVLQAALASSTADVALGDDVVALAVQFSAQTDATGLLVDWYTEMCRRRGMAAPERMSVTAEVERAVKMISTAEGFELMARELLRNEQQSDSFNPGRPPARVAMQISGPMEDALR